MPPVIEKLRGLTSSGLRVSARLVPGERSRPGQLVRWILGTVADLVAPDAPPPSPAPPGAAAASPRPVAPSPPAGLPVAEIETDELRQALAGAAPPLLLDVREPLETQDGIIPGARLMPMQTVLGRIGELRAAGGPLVIYCHKGIRSGHVAIQLGDRGVRAQSLRGGIESWMAAGGAIVAPQPNGAQAQPAAPPPARSFVRVGAAADLGPGQSAVVEASGRSIAIFNVGGSFFAVDNRCLHRGGSLGQGELSGTTVRCPEHGWRYDVTTGRREGGAATLVCFAVRVTEGQLEVAL